MPTTDPKLLEEARRFADEIADLLHRTVCADDPPVRAQAHDGRAVVGPVNEDGHSTTLPLMIRGEPRLDLRLQLRCTWDFTGHYLAIEQSTYALTWPGGEPLVRFDYDRNRSWAPAHVQLHAESSTLGFLMAHIGTVKPPKTQQLHLPVGGPRFRPSLEDVIEFAIEDLKVDTVGPWRARIEEGRARWHERQVHAAIRDVIKNDPDAAPERLHAAVEASAASVRGSTGPR